MHPAHFLAFLALLWQCHDLYVGSGQQCPQTKTTTTAATRPDVVSTRPLGTIVNAHGFDLWLANIQYLQCPSNASLALLRITVGLRSLLSHSARLGKLKLTGDTECDGFPHRVVVYTPQADDRNVYEVSQMFLESRCMNASTACHSAWTCERSDLGIVTQYGRTALDLHMHSYKQCPSALIEVQATT